MHYEASSLRLRDDAEEDPPSYTESLNALAKRYVVKQKTIAKRKKRTLAADLPTGL
ncbi:hypothetical protein I6F15_30220 [Bradyrhizobium sp. BRP14]|nr:hypothetical protein [Bradyrhizobium sp. BRP14]